ncbi:MAG: YkgJ family cysteine cluster protein [Phycisphaerae bacterium]
MPGNLCEHCTGVCCRYFALPIDTPEDRQDFDDIRWYLLHDGVSVFVEEGEWYLYVESDCCHLRPDFRCALYATRPRICREYTTENCDYHSGEYDWEQHFTCPEHLDDYARGVFANRRRRRRAVKRSAGRPRLKARLHSHRPAKPKPSRATNATSDIRGTPLPVLGVLR